MTTKSDRRGLNKREVELLEFLLDSFIIVMYLISLIAIMTRAK
jgi:hypothetical protein